MSDNQPSTPAPDQLDGSRPATRAVVIGLDAAIPARWMYYADQGKLPNFAALLESGTLATNCLVPFPTITPPNWTTISTGATPAVHGITDFHLHHPGDRLNEVWQAFDESSVHAERLWTAWAAAGAASIVMNYVGAWPPTVERGFQVAGHGLDSNEWRTRADLADWRTRRTADDRGLYLSAEEYLLTVAGCDLISTADDPLASEPTVVDAVGWDSPAAGSKALACPVRFRRALHPVDGTRRWALLSYKGGVRVGFYEQGDTNILELAALEVGQWSPEIRTTFATSDGDREAVFRLKLLDHNHATGTLRLFVTPLCDVSAGVSPAEWADELGRLPGLPLPTAECWDAYNLGWIDGDTLCELEDMEHQRVATVVEHATELLEWSLLILHDHTPDWFGHIMLNDVDPLTQPSEAVRAETERVELLLYESLDRMIGRIVAAAGSDAVVVLVSDHGQIPSGPWFNPRVVFEEAGLLAYSSGRGDAYTAGMIDPVDLESDKFEQRTVDWARTRAVPQRSCFAYVNLRGRDPDGIVEPGEEYDSVCDQIIRALLDYTDPATGLHPVALALRRRDAQVLGTPDNDLVGDVVYALNPPYGVGHAQHLPSVAYGLGAINALLLMRGPGIREGTRLTRRVGLEDIAPTLSHLLDLPVPKDADGGVIYQALIDPNRRVTELRELRRDIAKLGRVRNAYEKTIAVSHSYNDD